MKKGFTLIELIVIIMIIGILAGLGFPIYKKAVERTRQAEGINALKAVYDAQMRHYARTGEFSDLTDPEDLDIELAELKYFRDVTAGTVRESAFLATIKREVNPNYEYTLGIYANGEIDYAQGEGPGGLP